MGVRSAIALATALLFNTAAASAETNYTARNGAPDNGAMYARGQAFEGMSFVRPVLSGVLYRGGFQGGDSERTGLNDTQRQSLCDAGFSQARYADFGKNTSYGATQCSTGSLNYQSARSSRPSEVMQAIHNVIQNPSEGPVMVHCMWGVHASGALSAMALVQFCGWSESRAKDYWNEARNGAPCSGGCDSWIDRRFEHFSVDATLNISDVERAAICPE